jgi:hypothetical protein
MRDVARVYAVATLVFFVVAGLDRLTQHTSYNHYALQADAWLHGRWDLPGGPPAYAEWNDFAVFEGRTYVSFPPLPALLVAPFVALAGSPERCLDGLFFVTLAGAAPALLFAALETLRLRGYSQRSSRENTLLALLFAFGTVYFSCAVQGTVWFAGHVVATAFLAAYLLVSIDAKYPVLAGAALACACMTRPTTLLAAPLFLSELLRTRDTLGTRARALTGFAIPLGASFVVAGWCNVARFGDPLVFGHEHLQVFWHARITTWGLFSTHYLSKNLGAALTTLPWFPGPFPGPAAPFRVSLHGLALWFTTPLYLWLLWPTWRNPRRLGVALAVSAALVAGADLLYQNTGWWQFGYRFSNDYSVFLFAWLALSLPRFGHFFYLASVWCVGVNLFGAVTYAKPQYLRYYDTDSAYLHPPD